MLPNLFHPSALRYRSRHPFGTESVQVEKSISLKQDSGKGYGSVVRTKISLMAGHSLKEFSNLTSLDGSSINRNLSQSLKLSLIPLTVYDTFIDSNNGHLQKLLLIYLVVGISRYFKYSQPEKESSIYSVENGTSIL